MLCRQQAALLDRFRRISEAVPQDSPSVSGSGQQPTPPPTSGEAVDDGKGRIFPCEECGADVEFHIGSQALKCPYCGHVKHLDLDPNAAIHEQDFETVVAQAEAQHEAGRHDEEGQSEVRCESCGGTVVFLGTLTSTHCPYCGTPIQRDKIHSACHRIPVDGVLPFLVENEVARRQLAQWVKSRWFAPNAFLKQGVQGGFNGVYLRTGRSTRSRSMPTPESGETRIT